ncbi:MAG: hypothetical protein WCE44_00220 [Candidatus Velthaea sp.]|jgi:hypothetical protein
MKHLDRIAWTASLVIAILGYAALYRPLAQHVANIETEREMTALAVDRNLAIVRDRAALIRGIGSAKAQLAGVDLASDVPQSVAIFIQEAARRGAVEGVHIVSVDARPPVHGSPSATARLAPAADMSSTPIDLSIEGSYAHVLSELRHLSHERVAAHVQLLSIERGVDAKHPDAPSLNARVHVDLLHHGTIGADHATHS